MKQYSKLLRAIHPDVLLDNFDVDHFEKSESRFGIWLDEKNDQLREDKYDKNVIAYGFGDYRTIRDCPIRGRATYLHVRKARQVHRRDVQLRMGHIRVLSTRLNAEFIAFFKEGN